jgi:methylmalonyl-CoA mutase
MAAHDLTAWRALVDKELAGAPFDKLVHRTAEGLAIEPLYTERPGDPPPPGAAPFVRGATAAPFRICMRVEPGGDPAGELAGGAEALWCRAGDRAAIELAVSRGLVAVVEPAPANAEATGSAELGGGGRARAVAAGAGELWSAFDWIAEVVAGRLPPDVLDGHWPIAPIVRYALDGDPSWRCVRISTLPFHDAGADAGDEIALAASSLVASLRRLDEDGLDVARAARLAWVQVAIGRDTFGELCKLRALRVVWHKVLAAAGVADARLDAIHAVCSARTLSQRDPWVNMLRVTTQVFAAALGGAQLITPLAFDAAFAQPSALGQRVARNTALVLREESQLGRVLDAGGGSYYLEARTDALAREAWSRFTAIERDGGIVELLRTGALRTRLDAAWARRAAAIAKRKEPVLGVSEFANLREQLPGALAALPGVHRDAEAFEVLRARNEAAPRDVALIPLGPPAEHRARTGFAEALFATVGLRAQPRELPPHDDPPRDATRLSIDIACLCGSDERYAAEAAATARALRSAGARRVVLAGRPGALEAELRAAGVDAFIYVGCDAIATLEEILA